jgi:VCBS repeat-containing protein
VGTPDKKFPWRKKATPKLLALEPRMLFDGAAVDATLSLNKEQVTQAVTDAAVTDPVDASAAVQLKLVGDTSALNADSTQTLSLALAQTQQQLLDFANSDRFYSTLEKIYNPTGMDPEGFSLRVEQLRANILGGGLNISIELRSATELAGYLAAYAAVGEDGAEKIYLDKDWVNFGLDQQMVSRALLEEIGHAIDQRLNGKNDTAGDEGEYFSRVVNQDALTTEDIQQLTTEDDHGVALIDGRSIEVEHASITFTKAYQGMNATYTAVDTTSYGIQTSSIYIGSAISSTAYTFQSANPADVQFSGNNVAGQLIYYSGGSRYVYNGLISRPDKTGNTPKALYFAETTVLGGATPTGRAFLLVMPGYEASYSTNQSVSTSSDPIATSLNSVLTSENSNHPPVITSNGGGDNASISFAENTSIATAVTTVTSTDLDTGDTKSFSIYGGADAALFQINSSTGVLTFKSSPDYENPLDADRNNLYDVRVMVADSKGATDTQTLTVTVTNVNDNTPVITSNGGGDTASISVPQLTTAVTKVVSTDADVGDVVGYSISGGANSALFSIDASTGQLSFASAPVYNAGGNNTYYVTVQARDIAGHTDTQALTVTVTNVDNIAPTLAISSDKALLGAGKMATITFTFSEPVQGFTLSDVTVAGGTLTNLVQDPSYPTIYRASFTQSGSSAAPSFSVASGTYQDTSGNNGAAASLTLTYDVVAPTVAVDIAGTDIAFGQTKTVTFTFSEDPSGTFTIGDIASTNGIVTNLLQSSTDSKVFTASIQSTSSTGGPVVVAVAGSYTDAAGNLGSGGQDSATLASPSIDLANTSASDTGSSSVDNITTNQKPVIVGNAPLSETAVTVTVTFGATTLTYNSVAVSNGTWSLDLSTVTPSTGTMPTGGMTEGYVGLTVALTSSSSVTASSSFLIDLTPPSTPTVTAQTATTSMPTIVGTTASDTDVLKVTVNGVTYTSDDGYLSYVKGSTTWSLVIPAVNALSSATYPVTAAAYDLAGKSATDATTNELTVNLNTAAPIVDLAPSDALTLNNTATYTQGGTSVAFAKSGVNISDADSTNLASFTVGYVSSSVETGDRFELGSTIIYLASGVSTGTVYFNGTYFSYAFTTVGGNAYLQFTSRDSTNSSNAVAATASYEALLDALKFSNDAATFTNNSTRTFSVTANDGSQSSGAATFSITMVAANHAPVLDAAQSPVLTSVTEDSGVPTGATGTLVSSLVSGVSDADTGALKGIAITAINATNGALYYSTDGGASWSTVGAVSSTSALLLAADGNTRLYYVPSANYNGTVSDALTFSAWDRTSGVAGTKVSTASSGGTAAFSTVTDTVAISVTAVNDAPVASGSATLSDILEDTSSPSGATVSSLFASNFSDSADAVSGGSSANTLSGVAITAYTADAAKGNWQYTTNGTTWTTIGTVSDTSALTLGVGANDKLRFVPSSNWNGAAPTLSVRLIDSSTTVTTGATVNVSVNGGATAYSSGTVALSTSVTAVNDAPVASGSATLSDILEDTSSPSGATVSSLFASNFSDSADAVSGGSSANTLSGVAITAYTADAAKGNWQYTTNGTTWTTIGTVSDTSALTLGVGANDKLRFVPSSNWNGAAPTLSVRLIDSSTTVTTGATVNVSVNGGATAYSSGTVALSTSVTAVNDAPVASGSATLSDILEDTSSPSGATVSSLFASNFSDSADAVSGGSSANTLSGVAITAYTADAAKGNWQYTTNGTTWTTIGTVSDTSALTLGVGANDKLRFVPSSNWNGAAPTLSVRLIDSSTTVTTGATVNVSVNGGATAYSSGTVALSTSVTAVNDAPVASGSATLSDILEDTSSPSGATVSSLFASNFSDSADAVSGGSSANTLSGVAITAYTADAAKGNWQYTTNGTTWTTIGTVSDTSALTLGVGANDKLRFVPSSNWNGAAPTLSVRLIDSSTTVTTGATVNVSVNGGTTAYSSGTVALSTSVTAVNDAPSGADKTVTTLEDVAYTLNTADFGFSDPDGNSLLAVKITTVPVAGSLTLNGAAVSAGGTVLASDIAAGNLVFTPASNANGTAYASFTFQVQDDGGTLNGGVNLDPTANTITINVTAVNDAPSGADKTVTTLEDVAYTLNTADFGFSDPDGNSLLAVKITTVPVAGSLTLNGAAVSAGGTVLASDIAAGNLVFTPASNANGTAYASFTFQVQDDGGTLNGGVNLDPTANTITINVTAVNDAPSGADKTVTTLEDVAYTLNTADFGFSDPDGNSLLAVKITTVPVAGSLTLNGAAVLAGGTVLASDIAAGNLVFTPASNANGTAYASFTFQVQDDGGTLNGGVNLDPTANTITINVTAVNDPPIASDASFSTIKNTVYNGSLPTATDVEGDSVSYASVSGPSHGTLLIDSTGNYSYTPATNYVGSDSFTYAVSDGHGGSNTYTVSVTTVESNHAPVNTVPGTQTVDEDTALLFTGAKTISVSDSDGNLATTKLTVTNGTLTVDVSGGASISTGANGTTTLTLSGTQTQINLALATLSYQGSLNYNGSDALTVLSSDNAGVPLTASDTVTITVNAVNDAAVLGSATKNLTETNSATDISSSGTLTISDVDSAATFVAQSDAAGTYGQFSIGTDGAWTYTASSEHNEFVKDQTYTDSFEVFSADGTKTTVVINILGTNDLPMADDERFTVAEDVTSVVIDLLSGDTDVDGDLLSVESIAGTMLMPGTAQTIVVTNGQVNVSASGSVTFTPAANYSGSVSFDYVVSDGKGGLDTGSVNGTVTPVNDAATFTGIDSASVTEDSNNYVKTGTLKVSDVDSPTTIVAQTNVDGAYGRFSIDSDGHWTYVADNAKLQPLNTLAEMADTFTVTTADGTVHDIVVTLDGVVDVLSISSPTAVEGTPLIFDVLLSGTTQAEQQFLFRYTGGTAVPGADFTNLPVLTPVGTGRISFDAQTGLVSVSSGVVGFHASFATQDDLVPEPVRTVDIQVEDIPSIGYISDGADMALTVENMTVNEASPYVVFRLNGVEGQQVQLSLVNFSASDVPTGSSPATIGLDTGTQIQYFDGYGWRDYAAGSQVTYPAGSTTLLVRVSLINDNVYEGPEAFKLVAVGSSIFGGGNSVVATGLGTIGDNGRGPIYNQSGAEVADAVKDDDRLLKVSSITVNEGSEYAVFSVSLGGTGSRAVSLALIEGSGSGFANIDQGQVIQYWNGAAWNDYVANAIVTIPDASALLVKVDIAQESDVVYEGPETFNLNVVGAAATEYGVATIIDDGTGVIYTGAVVGGVPVTTKLGLDDDLDKDGIPPNVEEILATLSSSSGFGGNPGDLNGDGVPDAEQPAVATLAWINADYFNSALSGDLAEVRPIISMSVVSPDAQQRADAFYQLESISVVHQNDARFNGIDPAVSVVPGQTISTSWDPIVFSVAPVSGSGASLVDIDGTRAGTQIMVTIDISRSGLAEGAFNAYLKYVSQDVIAAAGGTLTDLDGQSIQKAGWYDFMQRQDANGNYHGDGARFVVKNGKIMAVQLTFTDNAFGDSNMAANMITDPGMPVHVTVEPVQPFVPAAIPKFLNLDANPEAKEKEKDKLELDQGVPRVEVKGEWATKAQFTKASLNNALLKAVEPEPAATSKAQPTDRKSASGDKDSGLRNTLTPPDAVAGADGRLVYQLPQGTFTGGQGPVHLEATLKDGSPLPSWVSFDRATGRVVGHMPGGMVTPIEIKVQARDSKGNKAETVFKLKTRPDQVGWVGKQSLTAQLDNAMRWRA